MQHEVHDEISLEMVRRVADRLREQPALLQICEALGFKLPVLCTPPELMADYLQP